MRVDHHDGSEPEVLQNPPRLFWCLRETDVRPVRVFTDTAGIREGDYYIDTDEFIDAFYEIYTANGYTYTKEEIRSMWLGEGFRFRFNPTGTLFRYQSFGNEFPEDYTGGAYLPQYAMYTDVFTPDMRWVSAAADASIHLATAEDAANSPWVPLATSPEQAAVGDYYLDFSYLELLAAEEGEDAEEIVAYYTDARWYVNHDKKEITAYKTITNQNSTFGTYTMEKQLWPPMFWYENSVRMKTCVPGSADPQDHLHSYAVAETAATAAAHGYTAGVYCPDCGAWISGHEVIHNTLGAKTVLAEPTVDTEGEAIITCTVCGERGYYAIEKLPAPEEPAEQDDGHINPIERIRKAFRSFVDWVLRLIKWLGGK